MYIIYLNVRYLLSYATIMIDLFLHGMSSLHLFVGTFLFTVKLAVKAYSLQVGLPTNMRSEA